MGHEGRKRGAEAHEDGHPEEASSEKSRKREKPRVAPGRPHEPRASTAPKDALELQVPGVHVLRLNAAGGMVS